MPRREIRLTYTQARLLALLVVILSVGFVGFSLATFFILKSRENVKIEIVEIPPAKIEIPIPQEKAEPAKIPEQPREFYRVETYDYAKLVVEATELIERGTKVSTYVLEPSEALGVLRAAKKPFFITELSKDACCISFVGGHAIEGKREYNTLYGVFVLSSTSKDLALERMFALRSAGFPAYLMKFTRDGRDWFTLVVGAFPTSDSAEDFNKNLDWSRVMRISGASKPGYTGRISP
ncbi:SPOR domain-containing protein [Pseudothermotoga sp.]|nr:SPOR domain-containing protein [Pseudothermotoga sp.]MCX7813421.1 SPOR domain-containing protein [Pseudothermotoga sp.]MDW8139591.1 SPOR domain-containing protein [Pseudothermotoga sp.]